MASAYELSLVLRGRNYLSNDLRRAGADIGRLKTASRLQAQTVQLRNSTSLLAKQRAAQQLEFQSLTSGAKRLQLDRQIAAQKVAQNAAALKVRQAEERIQQVEAQRLTNAATLSQRQRTVQRVAPRGGAILQEAQNRLNASLITEERLRSSAATANKILEDSNIAYASTSISADELGLKSEALAADQMKVADAIKATTIQLEMEERQLARINELSVKALNTQRISNYAQNVEHLGRAFQTLGLVGVAALGYAAYAASKFNTELTLASTQATLIGDRTTAKVQANSQLLQSAVQNMLIDGNTAVKPADLNEGLYTIFSGLSLKGGQKQQLQEGLGILKDFSQVFTANFGQVQFNEVTKAGIALINNFGLKAQGIPRVMNQMQASVRFGAITMSELTSSLNQVIPAFKAAGYGTKQMFEDIAFVSRVFPALRFGTTGLARLTETFGKYHDAISRDIGRNIAPNGKLQSVATIVSEVVKAHPILAKGGVDLQNYFKTVTGSSQFVNARRVFSAYVTDLGLYHKIAGQVGSDTHELAQSFADMSQTPQVRWAEFTNELRGLVLEIGSNALPIFQKIAGPIKDVVHWFDQLSPSTKKLITQFAAWSAIGLLVTGTALVFVGAVTRMGAAIRLLLLGKAGVAALEEGFISMGTIFRVGLIGVLIVAIPLLIHYHTEVGHVIDKLGGIKKILEILTIAMVTFKFSSFITGLKLMTIAEDEATAGAARLRLALLAINAIGIVTATVVITYIERKQIDSGIKKIQRGFVHAQQHSGFIQAMAGGESWIANLIPGVHVSKQSLLQPLDKSIMNNGPVGLTKSQQNAVNAFGKQTSAVAILTYGLQKLGDAKKKAINLADHSTLHVPFDVNAAIANVERLRKISEKTYSIANFKAYEDARAALEKHFTGTSLTALNDYLSAIESATKKSSTKVADAAKKAAAELKQELLDAASNAMSMYDSLLQQNQSVMGTIFSGPYINSPLVQNRLQFGGKLSAGDYLKDLKSQTTQFTTFYRQIGRLQKRGAPQELINQLIAAGPTALPAIKALAGMGDSQWSIYIKTFARGQQLLHKQTIIQLTSQLKDYRKYGEKIALQIISGMRDKRIGLSNEIKNIIKSIFGVTTPVTHGPSKTHGTTEHHTHFHVTAPKSEHTSIKTQLRHAGFAAKAKYERTR